MTDFPRHQFQWKPFHFIAAITPRLSGPYVDYLRSLSRADLEAKWEAIRLETLRRDRMTKAELVAEITADTGLYRRQLLAKTKPELVHYLRTKDDTKAARTFAEASATLEAAEEAFRNL